MSQAAGRTRVDKRAGWAGWGKDGNGWGVAGGYVSLRYVTVRKSQVVIKVSVRLAVEMAGRKENTRWG